MPSKQRFAALAQPFGLPHIPAAVSYLTGECGVFSANESSLQASAVEITTTRLQQFHFYFSKTLLTYFEVRFAILGVATDVKKCLNYAGNLFEQLLLLSARDKGFYCLWLLMLT